MGDTFAQKTMRGMISTFGTLAAVLHLPAGCCGVGAIEAQIAAGDDDASASGEELSDFIINTGNVTPEQNSASTGKVSRVKNIKGHQRAKGFNGTAASLDGDKQRGGGLRGLLSSARSLGRWKGRGEGSQSEDDQSETSNVSALSFLSGGLKLIAAKGAKAIGWRRQPNRVEEKSTAKKVRGQLLDGAETSYYDECSDVTSMDEFSKEGVDEEERMSGATSRWRRVRMIVSHVRGEGSYLAETVRYRSARRIQCLVRRNLARSATVKRRAAAFAARQSAEDARLWRRRREAEARKKYRALCREEGRRILDWSVKIFLQPKAIVDLQRVWRGHRARKRLAAYLKWLEDRARRRREYERYLAALAARRGVRDRLNEQVKRRVWGRVEFAHTGWKPRYEVENPPDMHDHVLAPPRGSSSGVRTFKVVLPPRSERDRRLLVDGRNAWAGVPVGVAKRRAPPERLGAPPRPGTITANRVSRASTGGTSESDSGHIVTKYNWLPAPLLGKVGLLQTPLQD